MLEMACWRIANGSDRGSFSFDLFQGQRLPWISPKAPRIMNLWLGGIHCRLGPPWRAPSALYRDPSALLP